MTTSRVRLSPKVRRAQIVRSAIAVIAEVGYNSATFVRIAQHAGLASTGLISHHFEDRNELMQEVVAAITQRADDFVQERTSIEAGPSAALNAYIAATIDFHSRYPQLSAVISAVRHKMPVPDGYSLLGVDVHEPEILRLQQLMRRAQMLGEMAEFDTKIVATSLHHTLEAATSEVRAGRADPDAWSAALVRLFAEGTGQRAER